MSSASSGRYQSRLFNFVHQRSRRLREQCDRAFRHLRVATSWVAPVVLYPIYLLFQSTESARKMHQAVQQSWPKLQDGSLVEEEFSRQLPPDDTDSQPQIPSADTPIQQVLLLVDVPSEEAITHPSPSHNRLEVRGIATQLLSRTLVLVTAQNEILDILTPQQQQKLQERIIGEVANYWRYQRLAHSAEQGFTTQLRPHQAVAFLDRTVANLEAKHLATVSEVAIALSKSSWGLGHWVQTQLTVLLSGKVQLAGSRSQDASDTTDARTFRIQALIWAAIDYFFGHHGERISGSNPQGKPLLHRRSATPVPQTAPAGARSNPSSRQLPPRLVSFDVDPWLTLRDLFGDSELSEGEPVSPHKPESLTSQTMNQLAGKTNPALPSSRQSAGYSLRNLLNRFQKLSAQPKQTSKLVKRNESGIKSQSVTADESNQPRNKTTQLDPAPDWIEARATAMGYVKHPLEQLLEWLDRAMLWIEELLMKVFQWVRSSL